MIINRWSVMVLQLVADHQPSGLMLADGLV
jgi:hypothetical protein